MDPGSAYSTLPDPRLLIFGMAGHWEILIILLVILLLFGSRLPNMARNLGKSFTEFKKGIRGAEEPKELPRHEGPPKAEARTPAGQESRGS